MNSTIIEDIFVLDSKNQYETSLIEKCFNVVDVFVIAVDLDGGITLINQKGRKLLGLEKEKVIGSNFINYFENEDEKLEFKNYLTSILKNESKQKQKQTYRLLTTNNQVRFIEARNTPIYDKENSMLGILISGEDISELVQNQQELQYYLNLYRILAQNIPDINLYLFDQNLQFIIAEGAEMKNNGLESNDFEQKNISEIDNEKLRDIWMPFFEAAISGKEISSEYKFNNYYYLIWVIPIMNTDKRTFSGIAITQNITDDKRNEKKLKRAKVAAEKANRAKSDFLARVSHEIRTPLNAILGFTEQIKQTPLNAKQEEYIKIVDKSSEHLLSLINDILVLSKIEARQINFDKSPFKIEHTVKYVFNALQSKAREKSLDFNFNIDPKLNKVVLGDSFRLRQILLNMLNNAIKFTANGYVELRCFLMEKDENTIKVRFDIIDTGMGIKPENLKSIFEQFKQGGSGITQKYGGTGLGLTICKNLIDMQDGSLWVSSQENIGTTFSFILPYEKGKKSDIVTDDLGEINSEMLKDKSVLLVDDDSVNRLLGKTILDKFNCKYDIANNGTEAIDKLDANQYDVVLLDIHMPDISGIEVAKYFKEKKKNNTTKIVAVTAAVMKDDISTYYKVGINDFLVKPYKEVHLFNKICEVLQITKASFPKPIAEIILKEEIHPNIYDLSELRKMTGNDKVMMINMLETFIENSEQALEKFEEALAKNDTKQIAETAHKILPSYRHLAVNSIISELLELKSIKQNDKDISQISNRTRALKTNIQNLLLKLSNEINHLKS